VTCALQIGVWAACNSPNFKPWRHSSASPGLHACAKHSWLKSLPTTSGAVIVPTVKQWRKPKLQPPKNVNHVALRPRPKPASSPSPTMLRLKSQSNGRTKILRQLSHPSSVMISNALVNNPRVTHSDPNRMKRTGAMMIATATSALETSNVVIRIANEKLIAISTINPIKTSLISVISSPNAISRTNTTNRKSVTSRVATKHRTTTAMVIAVVVTMISAIGAVSANPTERVRRTVATPTNKTTATKARKTRH